MIGSKMLAPGAKCILMDTDLASEIGKSAALLLQQIHYWMINDKVSGIIHNGKKWIINSYEDWADDLGIVSKSTIQRSLKKLKSLGLIEVNHLLKEQGNRTNCVSLKYDQIEALLSKNEKTNNAESPYLNAPHRVKMTLSSSQNESIIYSDKITNKDILITKSEEQSSKSVVSDQSKQVQQVDELKKYTNGDEEKPNQSTTVQDMVTIWNKIFPNSQAKLTKELSRNLNYAFQNKFDSDMNLWKNYCLTIESSGFLTSEKFSLHLDWAIKFKTMDDIENGRYGCKNLTKELKVKQEIEDLKQDILSEIDQIPESEDCKNLRHKLLRQSIYDYSRLLRNVVLYKDGRSFFFVTENETDAKDIQRTYPIDLQGLGTFERYEQIKNISDQPRDQKPQNDLDFELTLINSSSESEMIKEKRRELCVDLGVETYIKHFRILNLIEINGVIWVGNRGGEPVLLSDKIKELICDSLNKNNLSSHTEPSEQRNFVDTIEKLDESERCLNTRKALLKAFGIETYSTVFHDLQYSENGQNIDFWSDNQKLFNATKELVQENGLFG